MSIPKATVGAIVFSALTLLSCLFAISSIYNEVQSSWNELDNEIAGFRILTDDLWSNMIGLGAGTPSNRQRRQAYGYTPPKFEPVPPSCHCASDDANKCKAGPAGPPGEVGLDGLDGQPGEDAPDGLDAEPTVEPPPWDGCFHCPRGPVGPPGIGGPIGIRGMRGGKGSPGLPGRDGMPGMPGEMGITGPYGPDGKPGETGTKGNDVEKLIHHKGQKGYPGPIGQPGPQGYQGRPGYQGQVGKEGQMGTDGYMGAAGPDGNPGVQGPAGIPGKDAVYCPCPARGTGPVGYTTAPHRLARKTELLKLLRLF